ncbi:hypothetical protein F5J12DRAFT_779563 [Pisolithus orientalis]|uniref:uncharacterized protein n=1 Tax=Pisolithus orientalis TaxID=936130 RepID=UPI00222497C9|nr:uncharacterized protein F5J12DRAFT_779563 [Pisolithus orientalis]KAI6030401.1 hypothetical protein F5J12DRAFT_779563 [Pisolithus orientalis]
MDQYWQQILSACTREGHQVTLDPQNNDDDRVCVDIAVKVDWIKAGLLVHKAYPKSIASLPIRNQLLFQNVQHTVSTLPIKFTEAIKESRLTRDMISTLFIEQHSALGMLNTNMQAPHFVQEYMIYMPVTLPPQVLVKMLKKGPQEALHATLEQQTLAANSRLVFTLKLGLLPNGKVAPDVYQTGRNFICCISLPSQNVLNKFGEDEELLMSYGIKLPKVGTNSDVEECWGTQGEEEEREGVQHLGKFKSDYQTIQKEKAENAKEERRGAREARAVEKARIFVSHISACSIWLSTKNFSALTNVTNHVATNHSIMNMDQIQFNSALSETNVASVLPTEIRGPQDIVKKLVNQSTLGCALQSWMMMIWALGL